MAAPGAQSFSYDANDELTNDGYDLNGNTTSSDGHTYAYDFENRLVSKDGGAVTVIYDGDGNRVAKTAGGVTTKYLVDDLNPTGYLQVMDEVSAGAVQVRYTFGNMLVSQTRTPNMSPATSLYGYDAHGNVAFLTDMTGAETDTYTYDAWGNLVASTGSTPNGRLCAGEEFDRDIGLINLRARQYEPATGRFLTLDPLTYGRRQPSRENVYLYGAADPVNRLDPSGRIDVAEEALNLIFGISLASRALVYAAGATAYFTNASESTNPLDRVVSQTAEFVAVMGGGPDLVSFGATGLGTPLPSLDAFTNGFAIGLAGILVACEVNALSAFEDGTINTTNTCPSPCVCK